MPGDVVVLGAGMVGVSTGLALARRGLRVTVVDRKPPGSETSFGNSGVLSRSSIFPINGPGLPRQLPAYIGNRHPAVRWSAFHVLRNPRWIAGFLRECTVQSTARRAQALDRLIGLSMGLNRTWIGEAGLGAHLRETGWLKVWRTSSGMDLARGEAEALAAFGIATEVLDAAGVRRLEPAARPVFPAGLLITGSASVDDPQAIVQGYARLLERRGGAIRQAEIARLEREDAGWRIETSDGVLAAAAVVVALGPWSADLLRPLGLGVPLGFERGYHVHVSLQPGQGPTRPVYDVDAAHIVTPMRRGVRITSGVELADRDAPPRHDQIERAVAAARTSFELGERLDPVPWCGARPTLPDSLPMIGPVPGRPGLYAAFGHQHIGFSTGAGTGEIVAAQIVGETPPIDAAAFAPARYLR